MLVRLSLSMEALVLSALGFGFEDNTLVGENNDFFFENENYILTLELQKVADIRFVLIIVT